MQDTMSNIASGDKAKARDIIAAIRTLNHIEHERRRATDDERRILSRFAGLGSVALSLFPDPATGLYKDHGWQVLGDELKSLLSDEEYASARAHDVQRVLHFTHRHDGDARGTVPPRHSGQCHCPGAGLRHR